MSQEKPEIITSIADSVGRLTFSNPRKHNALPQTCWEAIPREVENLITQGARVIIVGGEGSSFCAGADISEFDKVRKNAATALIYEQTNIDAFASLRSTPVPTIAMIRGYCLGGGFGLAAACDLRIADRGAMFGVPAAKLGLAYPVEAMEDIVRSIGSQNAKRLLFTGNQFTAAEIHAFGFLGEVTPPNELDEKVTMLANEIASLAPLTHTATKSAINLATANDKSEAINLGNATFASRDYTEGRLAFKEKRKAEFNGS